MTEEFLHYIWRFSKLDLFKLETTEGEKIQIVNSGTYNTESGPDFSNARIRIGDQLWGRECGNSYPGFGLGEA